MWDKLNPLFDFGEALLQTENQGYKYDKDALLRSPTGKFKKGFNFFSIQKNRKKYCIFKQKT